VSTANTSNTLKIT